MAWMFNGCEALTSLDMSNLNTQNVTNMNGMFTVCKELTKKHETGFEPTLKEAVPYYEQNEPRGEYVLVLEGCSRQQMEQKAQDAWKEMSLGDHMKLYEEQGRNRKDAMKQGAKDRGVGKRVIYQALLEEE